jgi:phosphoribosyl 1,2-cyclic phosphate phosphodiesterase
MRVTVLGCGTSGGVPRLGNDWGVCDPAEPRNQRRRASILVEEGDTRVLVDTSPDMRAQLLDADVDRLDAVLYTHDHADHTHGIDELRFLSYRAGGPIDVYADPQTLATLEKRFDYAFDNGAPNPFYPPIARGQLIDGPFRVGDLAVAPFIQDHGNTETLGFRFGDFAYSTDLVGLPEASLEALEGVKVWIVDALRYTPHPTHANVEQALEWIERLRPRHAILTHMNVDLDYATLAAELPEGVEPAYDGMVIDLDASV